MNDDSKVSIEIDGMPLQARKGAMVIEVADEAGIRIPRFCYHKKLSIAANCRMCLVEVEKAPKPLPACATPVMEGMKVFTTSPKAIAAQKGTMEFLLINHPLDCPICDQGGECELQDVAMGYGGDVSRYSEAKRVVPDKNIGPLIATDMTRCIHCTRCVRFGIEVAGMQELGATGRGEHMRIGTYVETAVTSEMSGNVIDLCPVGALTAKPSRFSARSWELDERPGVAPHDCVGSNISVHTLRGTVNRVVPRDNEAINECWISDRDRFSYEGLKSDQRLLMPMIKENGQWRECDWETALEKAVKGLQSIVQQEGGDQLGMLVSPNATVEEMYLTQSLARALGCANVDHRLRQSDFSDQALAPVFPWLGQSVEDLEQLDVALLIGSNIRSEQPILAHRLRKASMRGAKVMFLNHRDFEFHFNVADKIVANPDAMVMELAAIAKALIENTGKAVPESAKSLLAETAITDIHRSMAETLRGSGKGTILLGSQALSHPTFSALRALAGLVADAAGVSLGYLTEGANGSGGWLAGVLPHRGPAGKTSDRSGLDVRAMLESPRKAYLLLGVEPEFDCWDPATAVSAIRGADFVVSVTPFVDASNKGYADVLLPSAPFAETSGTYVNGEGRWQSFGGASKPAGQSRPAWKILRVLGNLLGADGFDYLSSEEVLQEARAISGDIGGDNRTDFPSALVLPEKTEGLMRISGVSIYATDNLVRRSRSLQNTAAAKDVAVRLNRDLATRLGLQDAERVIVRQGGVQASLSMAVDHSIPDRCVWVSAGTEAAKQLGAMLGPIELEAD
jgi:NADH-quinone oxidoreductase subunit G